MRNVHDPDHLDQRTNHHRHRGERLTVAAVPTTLIIVSHDDHNTIAVIQPADEHSRVVLVSAVKKSR